MTAFAPLAPLRVVHQLAERWISNDLIALIVEKLES